MSSLLVLVMDALSKEAIPGMAGLQQAVLHELQSNAAAAATTGGATTPDAQPNHTAQHDGDTDADMQTKLETGQQEATHDATEAGSDPAAQASQGTQPQPQLQVDLQEQLRQVQLQQEADRQRQADLEKQIETSMGTERHSKRKLQEAHLKELEDQREAEAADKRAKHTPQPVANVSENLQLDEAGKPQEKADKQSERQTDA